MNVCSDNQMMNCVSDKQTVAGVERNRAVGRELEAPHCHRSINLWDYAVASVQGFTNFPQMLVLHPNSW